MKRVIKEIIHILKTYIMTSQYLNKFVYKLISRIIVLFLIYFVYSNILILFFDIY